MWSTSQSWMRSSSTLVKWPAATQMASTGKYRKPVSAQGSGYSCTLLRHSRGAEPESTPVDEGMPDEDAEEKARCDATNNPHVPTQWHRDTGNRGARRRACGPGARAQHPTQRDGPPRPQPRNHAQASELGRKLRWAPARGSPLALRRAYMTRRTASAMEGTW
jgi:hypothetical protein